MTNQTPSVVTDLRELIERLTNGTFFGDHDEDLRLLGVLRKFVEQLANTTGSDELVKRVGLAVAAEIDAIDEELQNTSALAIPCREEFRRVNSERIARAAINARAVLALATPDTELRREYEALQHDFDRRAAAENERLNENMTLTDRVAVLERENAELRAVASLADELINGGGLYTVAYADTPKLCVREKKDGSDPHARLCDALAALSQPQEYGQ